MRTGIETCFWVYLFYRPSADAYVCCLSVLPPEEVRSGQAEDELVYRSGFGEMDEALGHKLFLEHLSSASLKHYIQRSNGAQGLGSRCAAE
ncbi:hypothetical protein [uncultured Bacteroides sp.]|uniref:hypothetical protein n=1 Tax=uncultured Bacteroides sp. TaxID=162156 RepID=UPI0026358429|nr:hypothetical protein [uncultured Bacteroides sp.]